MPGKIEVTIAPTTLLMSKGDTAEATVTLHNKGQTVDQFTLSLEGLDVSWYTLPVSSVALFPNDQDNLKIIIRLPEAIDTKTTSYSVRAKATSQENPAEVAIASLTIQIRAIPKLELSISPQRLVGNKGTYQVAVTNPGSSEAKIRLRATDARGRLLYTLRPESLTLPAGGHAEANLEVRLGWLALIIGGENEYDFQVTAVPAEEKLAEGAGTVQGQLVSVPWYKFLQKVRIPWLSRPPLITVFEATTEDKREFKLKWVVKRAAQVKLDEADVESRGESLIRPTEANQYVLTATNRHGSSSGTVTVKPLPVPKPKASEKIRLSLSMPQTKVQAGGIPIQAMLQVQNLGEIVDKFLVEVEGLDESWYSRSASSIALMPQATDQVQISFQPPKRKGVKSGIYPFGVTIRSQSMAEEVATVVGQLEVLSSVEFKLKVQPFRITSSRSGTYRVNLANVGVTDINITLEATDLEEGCKFQFENENPVVAAWSAVEVPMIVRPKRRSKVGEPKRYDIAITATADGGIAQSANAELNHKPFMKSWRPALRLLRALIILAILAVIIYFALQLGGGWQQLTSSPQTWLNNISRAIENWFFR